jgi:hypothetical protein
MVYEGSTCTNPNYVTQEMIILNLTSKDKTKNFIITNNNPDYDYDACIEQQDPTDICTVCDNSVASGNVNEDACISCAEKRNYCLSRPGALLDTVAVSHIPAGEYDVSSIVTNPLMMSSQIYNTWRSYYAVPIETTTRELAIGEDDSDILIKIQNSNSIYNNAGGEYLSGRDDCCGDTLVFCCSDGEEFTLTNCCGGEFFCNWDHEQGCRGIGLSDALDYISNNYWPLDVEVC